MEAIRALYLYVPLLFLMVLPVIYGAYKLYKIYPKVMEEMVEGKTRDNRWQCSKAGGWRPRLSLEHAGRAFAMTKKERIIVPVVGLALLAAFTCFDLPVSMALYTRNFFGRLFEVVGELPFTFFAVFAFVLLFKFRSQKSKGVSIALGVVFGLLAALFSAMGGLMAWNYLREHIAGAPQPLAALIAALLLCGAILLARAVPRERARQAVTFALIAILYFVAVILVMNTVKGIWGRMRIREMTDPAAQFTRWYVITPRGGFDNAYASFPSGHAMNAAGGMLLCLLPALIPGLAGKEWLMKTIAYAWMVLICTSRVIMGAHFASDVTVGVLLSLLIFEVVRSIVCKVRKIKIPEEAA